MEVHEHNPERRFVIVPEDVKDLSPVVEDKANVERRCETDGPTDGPTDHRPRREQPKADIINGQNDADLPRSGSERRKSKHDLPPIVTELDSRRDSQHHRTQSAASRSRSDHIENRQSRSRHDQSFSPEMISSDHKVRDRTYRGMPQPSGAYSARSPSRTSQHFEALDCGMERDHQSHHRTSSIRQADKDLENDRQRRRMTSDADLRPRDEFLHVRSDGRNGSQAYARPEGPRPQLSTRSSRNLRGSADDHPRSSRDSGHISSKPVVIQDTQTPVRHDKREESFEHGRSTSRTNNTFSTATRTGTAASAMAYEAAKATSRDAARPAYRPMEQPQKAPKTLPPYPDDDFSPEASLGTRDVPLESRQLKGAESSGTYMPEPPAINLPDRSLNNTANTMPITPAAVNTSQTWNPAPFEPRKDGPPTERPVGTYRHFSESYSNHGDEILPECPRQKPVEGLMDWLTLPHTSFNICPSCYDSIFAKSDYRTFFIPILRPSDQLISCDFGTSPWYRIGWLLTLKDNVPDLRLLQQIAAAASNSEPCPGSRKATRSWLTVKDPHSRLPVDNFSVCYCCVKLVEILLPNLTGVFEPVDSRPRADVCALHFRPARKQFTLFFDALETTSDKAMLAKKPPDVDDLARKLWQLASGAKCREDSPVIDGYWHTMQFLREFTVCCSCFEDVVRPKLDDRNAIAANFYTKPQRLPSATCQLYSARMREIFRWSCRANDPQYLEQQVIQRRRKEKEIYDQLVMVDRTNAASSWKEEQVGKLVDEWRRWE